MGCMINEYMLRDRGGIRYKWQETPVTWCGKGYANIHAALQVECVEKGKKQTIPLCVLQELLQFSDMQWLNLLNSPSSSPRHLMTQLEPAFQQYERTRTHKDKPFFIPEDLFDSDYEHEDADGILVNLRGYVRNYTVDIKDFEKWADDNQDLLPENRYKPVPPKDAPDDDPVKLHAQIKELKEKLTEQDNTIKELKKAEQDGAQGTDAINLSEWIAKRKDYYAGYGRFSETVSMILDGEPISKTAKNMQAQPRPEIKDGLTRENIARFFNGGQADKTKGTLNADAQHLLDGSKDKPFPTHE